MDGGPRLRNAAGCFREDEREASRGEERKREARYGRVEGRRDCLKAIDTGVSRVQSLLTPSLFLGIMFLKFCILRFENFKKFFLSLR